MKSVEMYSIMTVSGMSLLFSNNKHLEKN